MPTAAYFGQSISPRLATTPEGFLICQAARLCRSGWQFYRASELGLSGSEIVEVYRPPAEVRAPSFVASLEGKCVTRDHPGDWVSSENSRWFCCGHCQNVHEGEPVDGDAVIIGDLIVTDASLIRQIEAGKREISVGYTYRLVRNQDETYSMHDLVANHLAVVDKGRAGSDFRILDHAVSHGRTCHCPRELARLTDRSEDAVIKEINFAAAARRFLGHNIMDVKK